MINKNFKEHYKIMLKIISKNIKKNRKNMVEVEAFLNIELENIHTPNNIKKEYDKTKHKIALYDIDLSNLKQLYKRIYKSNDYNKNNSFILALSILLISKILNIDIKVILKNLGIN